MKTYGYIRVSSPSQCIDRQMIALKEFGVPEKNIFIDKTSGKNFDRPAYRRLVRKLRRGDLLCIKSIDRLGRDCEEVQTQWRFLSQKKGVDIVVLDTAYLDTRNKSDFVHEFVNHIFLYVMSFTAENERLLLQQRQAEGIEAAKRRGVRFGRKCNPLPEDFMDYCELYLMHKISCRQAAAACGMAKSTFMDAVKRTLQKKDANTKMDEPTQSRPPKKPKESSLKKISEHTQNLLSTFAVLKNKIAQKEPQKQEKQQKSSPETTKIPDGNVYVAGQKNFFEKSLNFSEKRPICIAEKKKEFTRSPDRKIIHYRTKHKRFPIYLFFLFQNKTHKRRKGNNANTM